MEKRILHIFYECPRAVAETFIREMIETGVYEAIKKEEGCERYDYYYPIEGDGFILLEQWRDEAALDMHRKGEPMAALKAIKGKYPIESVIERWSAEAV